MKTYVNKVIGHSTDYWVCKECNGLNWYENEQCTGINQKVECDGDKIEDDFAVLNWVDEQLDFYKKEMNYTEDDCHNIEIYI